MDIEEFIPILIALFAILGFVGFLGTYFPVINTVPFVFSIPHYLFTLLGGLINPVLNIGVNTWAAIFEGAVALICILISYFVGH